MKTLFTNFGSSLIKLKDILLDTKFSKEKAENLIESTKIDLNHTNDKGLTLLDICLTKNKFIAANWLISKGVLVTTRNKNNISTVRLAVEKGEISIVENILAHSKFNINEIDQNGRSLLQDAVINGNLDIAKVLIENDININIADNQNRNVAFDAISYGDDNLIDEIIENTDIELNNIDTSGKTILHDPIVLDDDKIATKLLNNGADPTIPDPHGLNFLTYTALRGDEANDLLDTAIEASSNINAKSDNHDSVLLEVMYAFTRVSDWEQNRRSELKNVARKLISNGSDINDINKNSETILFEMVRKGDIEGCAFLLDNKLDINLMNKNYETPLYIAVQKGIKYLDIILLLIQYGANPTLRNRHSQTIPEVLNEIVLYLHKQRALEHKEYAVYLDPEGKYMLILKEILNIKDYDFNYLDSTGNPLFFTPFLYGNTQTTKLYLQSKVDINLKNKKGHNIFYEYVLRMFNINEYFAEFRENLVFLLVNNVDIDSRNKDGQTIYTKIALIHNPNLKLFRKLIEVTRYDYKSIDNLGRTIIHSCVWGNNIDLLNLVYGVGRDIQNIADNYNILPITYSAILGNKKMVMEFLRRDAIIRSGKPITSKAKEKFKPMLKNIEKLTDNVEDEDVLRKLNIFIEQTIIDLT
ncbi:MAG: ankyrin repeat domain-containing protein [Campylobacterota bacterium]|nr:ankyrin repeat domain-containing protein [Campylobacterota bacterium]